MSENTELITRFLNDLWTIWGEMSYSLLIGFFIAGLLSVFIKPEFIEKHLGNKGFFSILKASLLGVPLPICSCGVIPVSASLRKHGASKGATVSFLISTPQTGVDSIMVTYSLMGMVFGIFRPAAALINGIIGGILVSIFDKDDNSKVIKNNELEKISKSSCCSGNSCNADKSIDNHNHNEETNNDNKFIKAMKYGFITLPEDIAKALIIGIIVSAMISVAVPADFFSSMLGEYKFLQYIIMLVIGIPIYVCSTGSVPVATALIMKGISPGAALVFLMSGPATNVATMSTIWKIMGKKTLTIYLLSIALSSLAFGVLFDLAIINFTIPEMKHLHEMDSNIIKTVSGILLALIFSYAIFKRYFKKNIYISNEDSTKGDLQKITVVVNGMTCNHCASTVKRIILEINGIENVEVDLNSKNVYIEGFSLDIDKIKSEIINVGYTVL
ncbi:MAG: SO_0444 family Cu/Zn efflux transporter [Candidatus Muirbacterium halophilum]|nr:SO_0444 family Cu/Zn efflux transporter [Candidatus Muirbacterium halophilum]